MLTSAFWLSKDRPQLMHWLVLILAQGLRTQEATKGRRRRHRCFPLAEDHQCIRKEGRCYRVNLHLEIEPSSTLLTRVSPGPLLQGIDEETNGFLALRWAVAECDWNRLVRIAYTGGSWER